jgi:hypothetical protein
MGKTAFSTFMDRSRLDRLDHEAALIARDMLKTYVNEDNIVHQAFLDAGFEIYTTQPEKWWSYEDYVTHIKLTESARLLRVAREQDGPWEAEPGPVFQEIEAAPDKVCATRDEIATDIVALAGRFADIGYRPIEIGRALARVGLAFAPISFIERQFGYCAGQMETRPERERAMLDSCLGKDRYGKNKGTRQ